MLNQSHSQRVGALFRGTLGKNISYLFLLQIFQYVLPMFTFPYLTRVLGPQAYGLLAFSAACAAYPGNLIEFGFTLSAANRIAVFREEAQKCERILSAVITTQLLLGVGSFFVFLPFLWLPALRDHKILFVLQFFLIFANVVTFPTWFFQGMEGMKKITLLSLPPRILFIALVFFVVKKPEDVIFLPLLNILGCLLVAGLAFSDIRKTYNVRLRLPLLSEIQTEVSEAWHIFVSHIFISIYTTSNTVILGFLSTSEHVAFFTAPERIVRMIYNLNTPLTQAAYPHVSKLIVEKPVEGRAFVRKMMKVLVGLNGAVLLVLFLFARPITILAMGPQYEASIGVLRILAFLPMILALSNVFAIQTMIPSGRKRSFSRIVAIGSVLNLLLAFALVPSFTHFGTALSLVLTEAFVMLAFFLYVMKHRLI